jgi:predicted amidophosphoribosyltransferase
MTCPECGRAVPPQGVKLCPHCGYPLLLDKPAHVEPQPRKVTHKPTAEGTMGYTGAMSPAPPPPPRGYAPPPSGYQQRPVQQQQQMLREPPRALGPHCAQCRQVNPPHRKRCEICGYELWPGAAFPPRWMPEPPAAHAGQKRKSDWWKTALLIGLPLVAMGTVWALAYFL